MRIAVTGAGGFIGRYVVAALQRPEIVPVAVVRAAPARPLWPGTAEIVSMDIGQPLTNPFDALGRPDALIHLAWGGLPNYKSLYHFEVELPMQYRFLRSLVDAGLKNLVVAGTCFEYGMRSGPLSEDLDTRPSNPYGFAKDALRRQLEFLQKQSNGLALTWARLFYVYGDGQRGDSLFSRLKQAAENGEAWFDMSAGEQLRDYLPATSAAKLLVDLTLSGKSHGLVNVCSGRPTSVRTFVEQLIQQYGWAIRPKLGSYPYPDHEPMAFWGDTHKLQACLEIA